MGIVCKGCEHYDGSVASICDPAMNGRFRKSETVVYENLKLPEHDEDEDENSEDEDNDCVETQSKVYTSINEWICSGNYIMDAELKAMYSTMLIAAADMERLDSYRQIGDLKISSKVLFDVYDYDLLALKDDGFFSIFQ